MQRVAPAGPDLQVPRRRGAGDLAAKAVGKWHSLYLESDATPWSDDLACARAAFAALGVQVRCAPGGWSEEEALEEADRWIKIDAEGEQEIIWRTD